ncbi:dTDP-4-dehydrorhamnose reductase [Brevundimonas sp. Root1423]|uniref:dTDP-4-dehydrorhamnose reductase n=1 Tax=Brevundimonas sp. Root1423 TaxID=1736462 RepID=UPI0006FF7685|nr:dTDP-4-dehydrorhamnose reductase [Brevundimonas sp. Root1423]KQY84841.1 NAD(P)-dependent oxidoreductase [Brevundimonas sp. Root1423]
MPETSHILITGGAGQIGRELALRDWGPDVYLHFPSRDRLDVSDAKAVAAIFRTTPFRAVINAGAYTAVDRAETEAGEAFRTNALGPAILAEATCAAGIPLIQVSTDYVFNGRSQRPYTEEDATDPLGVYGASKLAGEMAVRAANTRHVILRTAWVLSPHRANFLKTMLRLSNERPQLRVVSDQKGSPTSAADIAAALRTITLRLITDPAAPTGTYHFVNEGVASWADLAEAIVAGNAAAGGAAAQVVRISTSEYPTLARRPANSVLNTAKIGSDYGITPRNWRDAVEEIISELTKLEERA